MEKLDRLGWAAGMCVEAYGRRIGIRVNDPTVLHRIPDRLPPAWKPAPTPVVEFLYSLLVGGAGPSPKVRRFTLLYSGSARLARTLDLEQALEAFESDLQLAIATMARGRLFVHAGVVGWRGRAILLPGRSLTGKSTLVAALLRAGATYYSDEYAVLDPRGRVHPYPRPLSLRKTDGARPGKHPAEALGGTAGVRSLPVGLVAVTTYRPGARWRPRLLTPGQAALALLSNTVAARRRPKAALATLRRVASQAPALRGPRGEAADMAKTLLNAADGWRDSLADRTRNEVSNAPPCAR